MSKFRNEYVEIPDDFYDKWIEQISKKKMTKLHQIGVTASITIIINVVYRLLYKMNACVFAYLRINININ